MKSGMGVLRSVCLCLSIFIWTHTHVHLNSLCVKMLYVNLKRTPACMCFIETSHQFCINVIVVYFAPTAVEFECAWTKPRSCLSKACPRTAECEQRTLFLIKKNTCAMWSIPHCLTLKACQGCPIVAVGIFFLSLGFHILLKCNEKVTDVFF